MQSNGPVFIVGCSRSGTTLVQSLVATSDRFYAFPEAGLLFRVAGDLDLRRFGRGWVHGKELRHQRIQGRLNKLGITPGFDWKEGVDALPAVLQEKIREHGLGREYSIRRICHRFACMLEEAARGRRWIEKTPQNIFVLDYLDRYFKNATFIHIVRSHTENIASLVDAASKYRNFSNRFGGPDGLDKAIAYYNKALAVSISRRYSKRHLILRYESLTADVDVYLRKLESFLSIPGHSLSPVYDISKIATSLEVWKQGDRRVSRAPDKARSIFNEAQLERVQEHALDPDRWFAPDDGTSV